MVKLTEYEIRLIAKIRGIKNYQNMSKEELLSTLDKLERITENLSKNGIHKIVKMQNLPLNELEQIERMNNLSLNELKKIAITRSIKNYKDISKEDLLIALLKSNQSHTKEYKGINEIQYLINKINDEDYYEPIKFKHSFDDNYIEYESRGDKYNNLSSEEYLNIIRPYLRDMIDNHKAHSE